jgi:hypothetical protein
MVWCFDDPRKTMVEQFMNVYVVDLILPNQNSASGNRYFRRREEAGV